MPASVKYGITVRLLALAVMCKLVCSSLDLDSIHVDNRRTESTRVRLQRNAQLEQLNVQYTGNGEQTPASQTSTTTEATSAGEDLIPASRSLLKRNRRRNRNRKLPDVDQPPRLLLPEAWGPRAYDIVMSTGYRYSNTLH